MKKRESGNLKGSLSKFLILAIFVIVIVLCFVTIKQVFNKNKLDQEIAEMQNEAEQLSVEKEKLLESIDDYQGDFYLESEARLKMNLKKQDENVVVVKLDDINKITSQKNLDGEISKSDDDLPKRIVILWWEYFFG